MAFDVEYLASRYSNILDLANRKSNLQLVLIKVAALCNIKCSYCYIYETGYINSLAGQPKTITDETVVSIKNQLNNISNFYNDFNICIHGGEPLLVGYKKLEFILKNISGIGTGLSIQTNGILVTNDVLNLLHEYDCRIGISLDGKQAINDKFRVDKTGKGSFDRIKKGIDLILEHPIGKNGFSIIIAVIDPSSDPIETYEYLAQFKPKMVDFLFKDGYYGRLPEGKTSLESCEYGKWLTELAFYYLSLDDPPVPIRKIDGLIEDYIKTKMGFASINPFGMLVINPNGSVTKNELYDIVPMTSSFSTKWNVNKDSILQLLMSQEYKSYTFDSFATSEQCFNCKFLKHCSGGYEIHSRWSDENKLKNPTIFCSDYKYFFDKIGGYCDEQMDKIATLATT